jgi:hypothetical protein
MAGVNLDIPESKQADAALREREELFRNMADTAAAAGLLALVLTGHQLIREALHRRRRPRS